MSSLALLSVAALSAQPASNEADLVRRARAIHERVIALDTHNDIEPENFTAQKNYTQRLDTQVNLPKMIEGGLDASFFIVYVGQPNPAQQPDSLSPAGYDRAYKQDIEKFEAVHRLTEQIAPDKIGLALTADDVRKIAASGRKVALIGVENGYGIGEDLRRVKEFYDRGGRYMSLAHNGNNQLSDSNTGERDGYTWKNGISPMGERVIAEMNRLGMMVDVSHPSKASMLQTVALSKAPVIASHSAVRALADHSRNMDDEQLLAMKKARGVVQVVAFASYVKVQPQPAGGRARGAGGRGRGAADETAAPCPIDSRAAPPAPAAPGRATVKDFVDHIDYGVRLIGIDHVGISSDFDGGGGIDGWNSAAETFNVTLELVRRGYGEKAIAKLWSGNLLRVWRDVEKIAKRLQADTE